MNKKILSLAIPNIISNISVPLVSAVDTMLMGHQGSAELAALGLVSMIFVFLYGSLNFLRMGTTGMTAQAFGAHDTRGISLTLYRALLVTLLFAGLLLLFRGPLAATAFKLMNVGAGYSEEAMRYFELRIWTAPAVLMLYALTGWYFGMQNAVIPLAVTLCINLVNIVLSYYFVMELGWGIEGAAYGTLIAQYAGLLLAMGFLLRYKARLHPYGIAAMLQRSELGRFLHVNKDIFIRTTALTFVFAFFYAQAAKESEQTLTVMILLLQFVVWFSYSLDGFANAAESLVGRYYGAKEWGDFHRVIRYLFAWGVGFSLLYMLFYGLFGGAILHLYTDQQPIIDATLPFMPYVVAIPLLSFAAFIWDGVFIGMTAARALRNAILYSTALFLGLFYLTKEIDFTDALWMNFMLFFLFRGVIQSWMFYREKEALA
ncbi:MATE family efflux transporter [Sulfurimonas diazotrophicus]|uniref:MATE family efflux transporter n=1 Tax=Sulfurimonas diazotrophicus TaxID=3131939 RepID=A0ABZ3HB20_9BACT